MADKSKMIQKLLEAGEENYSKALAALRGNGEKLPSFLRAAEGTVDDPRLVKTATSKVLPDIETTARTLGDDLALPPSAGAITDDVLAEATGNSSKLPNMAAPFVGAGLIGAGTAGYLASEEEPPVDTSVPVEILQKASREIPKFKDTQVKKIEDTQKTIAKAFENANPVMEEEQAQVAPTVADDFDARLADARSKDNDRALLFGLLKAAQEGGSAASGSKANTSYADAELADKNRNADRIGETDKLQKLHKDLLDDEVLRDSKSEISKQARDIAKTVGLKIGDNVTAKQLQDSGLNIGNLLTQKLAIDSRNENAKLQREMMAANKADKKDAESDKTQMKQRDSVDKMVGNLTKSDDYKGYQAAKTARIALDNALIEKNKAAIGSSFMMYAKIAQGDNSVVRESDMKNLAGSYNYSSPGEMISKLAAKAKGAGFTPLEMEQMKQVAQLIEKTKAKHIQQQLSPIRTRIENYGLNASESIDPALMREMELADTTGAEPGELTTKSKSKVAPPSQPIKIRNIQSGTVKTLSAEAATKYLQDPRFQRVD